MDWIMECNSTVEEVWQGKEEVYAKAVKAAEEAGLDPPADLVDPGLNKTERYAHCVYDDDVGNFIYSQITSLFCIGGMLGGASVPLLSAIMGRWGLAFDAPRGAI